jgi:hypothetical protein
MKQWGAPLGIVDFDGDGASIEMAKPGFIFA